MQIANKTLLVTGAGSGIGRALSLQLLQKGASVAGIDIHAEALAETQALSGLDEKRFKSFQLDITDKENVSLLPERVQAHFGQVDGLINNAGIIQPFKPIKDLTDAEIQRVFDINFFGMLHLSRTFLPLFLERPEAHIVNISSMGGFLPVPGQTIYGAAKAAVKLFTEGLYTELLDTNVRVTVIFPGAIQTNITENSGLGKPTSSGDAKLKPLPADQAAAQIIRAMEKNKFRATVGKDARFLDLLYRFRPRYAAHFIQKQMKALRK